MTIKIDIHSLVFHQLGEVGSIEKLITQLGVNIMNRVQELEAILASVATSIDSVKTAISAEGAEVKTRMDELIAQVGGINPGDVMTSTKLEEIIALAKTVQNSADGLTKSVEGIYVPGSGGTGVGLPGVPTNVDGNIMNGAGDIVTSDGTVRYSAGTFTISADGHHFDMVGNLIVPTSLP